MVLFRCWRLFPGRLLISAEIAEMPVLQRFPALSTDRKEQWTARPHDFAVRMTARSSKAPPASTTSRPAFVTIASAPLIEAGRRGL